MFDHKHYIPILKTKAGERWALGNLFAPTKSRIRPLLEIHAHKTKSHGDHIADLCEELSSAWGTDQPFYLDTVWLHGATGSAPVLRATFDAARACGLKAIPVARVTYGTAAKNELQQITITDKRGYLLRMPTEDASDRRAIDSLLQAVGRRIQTVDLMIDYQQAPMNLASDVPAVHRLSDWRIFTAASGSFPNTFATFQKSTWHRLPRTDFTSWESGLVNGKLPRKPCFADFACRDPGAPAEFGAPSVNARYALERQWLFWIGRRVNQGASADMHQLCSDLVRRPEYSGRQFSAGDAAIWDTAQGTLGPGNPTQWVQWHVNHHIELTVQQLQNHPVI